MPIAEVQNNTFIWINEQLFNWLQNYFIYIIVTHPSNFSQNETKEGSKSTIKNIIAVAFGKGRAGKPIVSTNLALSLNKLGATVSLVNTDLYGPSIPKLIH